MGVVEQPLLFLVLSIWLICWRVAINCDPCRNGLNKPHAMIPDSSQIGVSDCKALESPKSSLIQISEKVINIQNNLS